MTTQVAAGTDVPERLAVRAGDLGPVLGRRDVDPCPHDVVETRPGALERLADELEAERRLLVGALRRGRAVRGDRRRAGHVDAVTGDDGAGEARDGLVRRVPADQPPFHEGRLVSRRWRPCTRSTRGTSASSRSA